MCAGVWAADLLGDAATRFRLQLQKCACLLCGRRRSARLCTGRRRRCCASFSLAISLHVRPGAARGRDSGCWRCCALRLRLWLRLWLCCVGWLCFHLARLALASGRNRHRSGLQTTS